MQNPVLLLLDEPFSNLDPDMAGRMRQEVHALLRRMKTTTILVTHDHDEAFAMADRIAVLNQGVLEQMDSPELIYHLPPRGSWPILWAKPTLSPDGFNRGWFTRSWVNSPIRSTVRKEPRNVVMIRPDDIHLRPNQSAESRIVTRQFRGSEKSLCRPAPFRPTHS